MSSFTLILLVLSFLFLLSAIRGRWICWKTEDHQLKTIWYCWRTKQKEQVLLELLDLWPLKTMLFEVWNWKFERYIIHHDHLEEMNKFIARELVRNDIDLNMMNEAKKEYSVENRPGDKQ